jgi:hypothetical protein
MIIYCRPYHVSLPHVVAVMGNRTSLVIPWPGVGHQLLLTLYRLLMLNLISQGFWVIWVEQILPSGH